MCASGTTGAAAPASAAVPAWSGLKDRAEAGGGHLDLRSPPGTGTTLEITLALSDSGRAGQGTEAPTHW